MKDQILYICDIDLVYRDRFASYVMHKKESPFRVNIIDLDTLDFENHFEEGIWLISSSVFSKYGKFIEFIKNHQISKMIVLDESNLDSDQILNQELNQMLDQIFNDQVQTDQFLFVDKYQSAAFIYEKIIKAAANSNSFFTDTKINRLVYETQLIGVYAPLQCMGKSTFIHEKCMDDETERTLIISLEEIGQALFEGEGLSDLIYYYKKGELKKKNYQTHFIKYEKPCDFIGPVQWINDLEEMQSSDWVQLIALIKTFGIYNKIWIVLDHLSGYLELLKYCDQVYVLCDKQEEIQYIENLKKTIKNNDLEEITVYHFCC